MTMEAPLITVESVTGMSAEEYRAKNAPTNPTALNPGTKFRFTKLFPCMYATTGVLYIIVGADKHTINWRRINQDGSLGAGSGDSRHILDRCEFEVVEPDDIGKSNARADVYWQSVGGHD